MDIYAADLEWFEKMAADIAIFRPRAQSDSVPHYQVPATTSARELIRRIANQEMVSPDTIRTNLRRSPSLAEMRAECAERGTVLTSDIEALTALSRGLYRECRKR